MVEKILCETLMKTFPAATRGVAFASVAFASVAFAVTAVTVSSCTPKPEEPPRGIAVVQPTVSTEPLVKPTSRTPIPTKASVKVKPAQTKKPVVKVKPAQTVKSSTTIIDGMRVIDVRKGTGAAAVAGKTVIVDYRGTLLNGTQFDASYDRGEPFSFVLGSGQVIQGWDKGVAGMKVGGKRRLIIPPALGYGAQGAGGTIPPNATLIFEVELKDVQ